MKISMLYVLLEFFINVDTFFLLIILYSILFSISARMSLETTVLDVKRGVKGAPCTGILNYRIGSAQRRICAETYYFNKASAERLCYTLGLNMDRKPGSDKGVRLYR